MKKITLIEFLKKNNACHPGINFASQKRSLFQAWKTCNDPGHMLWLLEALKYKDNRTLGLYACWCACNTPAFNKPNNVNWDFFPAGVRKLMLATIDYINQEISRKKFNKIRRDLDPVLNNAPFNVWEDGNYFAVSAAITCSTMEMGDRYLIDNVSHIVSCSMQFGDDPKRRKIQADELRRRIPYRVIKPLAIKAGIKL